MQERLRQDKDDRCAKQANRIRLIADPNMSVQGLQVCVKNFLSHKQTQDLWLCISPPPGTPSTYGWHSPPHGEWLTKASGLLYELLAVAENSKIHSTKLCKALKALYDQKDLQVPLNHGHKQGSLQDEFDKYDFTIRVLMAMLRKLREVPRSRPMSSGHFAKRIKQFLRSFWPKFNSLRSSSWMNMFVGRRMA